jgi:hypothetical protein
MFVEKPLPETCQHRDRVQCVKCGASRIRAWRGDDFASDLLCQPSPRRRKKKTSCRPMSSVDRTQREFDKATNQRSATTRAVLQTIADKGAR